MLLLTLTQCPYPNTKIHFFPGIAKMGCAFRVSVNMRCPRLPLQVTVLRKKIMVQSLGQSLEVQIKSFHLGFVFSFVSLIRYFPRPLFSIFPVLLFAIGSSRPSGALGDVFTHLPRTERRGCSENASRLS